jgi:hypothetical protein
MQEQSSIKLAAGVLALLLIAVPLVSTGGFAAGASAAGIMVPLYTYPGGTWDTVAQVKRAHTDVPIVAIVNPASGPGFSKDSNYESGIANLKSAGVTVLGYVSTAYTNRDIAAVKSDMDRWKSWYPAVDGIFFDEQTNWAGQEWYYDQADSYAKSKGLSFTVGNPGANSIPSYLDTVDVVLIYESPGLPNLSNYQSWSSANNAKLGMIPFGVGSMPNQWIEDATALVGWIYVTHDVLPNPWDSIPPYLENMAELLDDGGSTVPPPPSTSKHTLTVRSVDQNGRAADGMWMEVKKGSSTVSSGFTPLTISLEESTYSVSASNYGQTIFNRWSDGSTSSTTSLSLSGDKSLTAHYNNSPAATPLSASLSADSSSATAGSAITFRASASGGTAPYTWSFNFGDGSSSAFGPSATTTKKYTTAGTYSALATARDSSGKTASSSPVTITISQETPTLTVRTADSSGNALSGYHATLARAGSQIQSGFSPAQFSLGAGQTYQVSVADYGNYVFSRWDDGSTSRTKTVSITSPTTITAHYASKQASLLVSSSDLSGDPINGLWTVIKKDGATLRTGYTPLSFSGAPGTYEVTVSDYQDYEFDRWSTGSTRNTLQVAVSGEVKLTALYSTGPSEVELRVRTAGLDGSTITGLWTVIEGSGARTTGFSPVSYDAESGKRYTVTVADYRNYVFDHWENGSKDRSRTITPGDDTVIIAHYRQ